MLRTSTRSLGALAFATLLCGCASSSPKYTTTAYDTAPPASTAKTTTKESMASEDIANTPPANLRVVMQAKTAWASSLLEAVSSRDYARIASNAEALRTLSLESGFLVQDTLAYRTLATEFRQEVTLLGQRAADRDQSGVEASYHRVTAACFRCHEYVNSERYQSSMPGRSGM